MRRYVAHSRPNAPNIEFKFYNEMEELLGHKETQGKGFRKSNIGMKADSPNKWVINASSVDSIEAGLRSNEVHSIEEEMEQMSSESDSREEQRSPVQDQRSTLEEQRSPTNNQWITVQQRRTPAKDRSTVQEQRSATRNQWSTVQEPRNPVTDERNTAQDQRRLAQEQNKRTYVNVVPIETLMDEYVSSDSSTQNTVNKRKALSAKAEYYEAKKMFIENENRRREADVRDKIKCRNEKTKFLRQFWGRCSLKVNENNLSLITLYVE